MARFWSGVAVALCLVSLTGSVLIRKDVEHLSPEDILNLQKALGQVNDDKSSKGYAAIAAYHGYPAQCKLGDKDVACCRHGSTSFPGWHRLYTVQMEQALKEKGLGIGIPYWDWTRPLTHLPHLVSEKVFLDRAGGRALKNVWYQGDINIDGRTVHTARAVDDRLFEQVAPGEHTNLFEMVLDSLEYDSFCQFEAQFEVAHNTIHYLVGGRNKYSLSHLDYTSYDPIFFLHHSNVDRIYEIYQKIHHSLESFGKHEICDAGILRTHLEPFDRSTNPFAITRLHSTVTETRDAALYGYKYENLTLNGHDLQGLEALLREKQSHDRAFATFRLHGIGSSANVRVQVCLPKQDKRTRTHCVLAGDFFILGGSLEMPWAFHRPYYFDITKKVLELDLHLTDHYRVEAELYSINGTKLPSNLLPRPYVSFRPAAGKYDPPIVHKDSKDLHVRKDVDRLTREEAFELREALQRFQNDHSTDGYQAIAEFHGDPGKCPYPTAPNRFACCNHGMPNFPHWHRLMVVQVEDALSRRGAHIGVPYWDWTKRNTHVPALAAEETYLNPYTNAENHNPFHDVEIAFLGSNVHTERDIDSTLTQNPSYGDHTELFDAFLLALEQDDFCDFEIQFEIAHNLIHGLVGGSAPHSMSSLSYSAFDPIFYLHHSNVDRIWAIWTALQQHRRKPYKAHCAQSFAYKPLKPFAFESPFNNNEKTHDHSTPTHIYDFEDELGYTYDDLEFGGMSIPELDDFINANLKARDRVFAGISLWGIKKSAIANIFVKAPGKDAYKAGRFSLLGGPSEIPWRYDRLYRHDITAALSALGLQWSDEFEIDIEMHDFDGTAIDSSQFGELHVIFEPKQAAPDPSKADVHIRKNVDELTQEEALALRHALSNLQEDKSPGAFQDLGRYHGTPKWCPTPDADVKKSCCAHGMPIFPHWHRLWTVQAENALRRHGYDGALPYWDWTHKMTHLPDLVNSATYTDPSTGQEVENPFHSAHIDDVGHDTVRSVRDSLYQQPAFGEYTDIARQVLLALEQDNFCDFEIQFEIAHNFIHALVGGNEQYSMASLMYTAYDPLFYLHHSNTDRIWAVWQALQKYRGKPYNSANCAIGQLRQPLSPFGLSSDVNPDPVTREHSVPFQVFDYRNMFSYDYDHLDFNGLTIPQLARRLEQNKAQSRVFAGFMLHNIGQSALVKFYICKSESDCNNFAGEFYLLGDPNEMDWAYDRLYKYDITHQLEDLHLRYNDRYYIRYEVFALDGTIISTDVFSTPTVLRVLGTSELYGQEYRDAVTTASHVRRDLESLSEGEVESLRAAFLSIKEDHTYEQIASFHGRPGQCELNGHKVGCCVHGMPTFPSWHRLYVKQVEEALLSRGSNVAVPYWDWTKPIHKLPALISEATYINSREQRFDPNPFFSGMIAGEDAVTTRDPQPELFDNDHFYEEALFAFEQDNFCDFEIQFEILHNAMHSRLGGRAEYSMASLDYSAFDPVFFLHHSNADRLWAIWQELQRFRGLPYNEADCAINLMSTPLRPFSDENVAVADMIHRYSRPADTFDYRNHLRYEYDTLEFNHMTIPQLDNLLQRRKENGRIFAGFLLHNIGMSADVVIYICVPSGPGGEKSCDHKAGVFSILGGELEMPFVFDRLYKHDITEAVRHLGLNLDSAANFELTVEIKATNGTLLNPDILPSPTILFVPGTHDRQEPDGKISSFQVRKEINSLSPREQLSLVFALREMQADSSPDGFQSIAAFHAVPPLCPSPEAVHRWACCLHGMATFPQWHRLYTVQVEDALRRHGSLVGIPYWDWTRVSDSIPSLLTDPEITDPYTGISYDNPFAKARIDFKHVDVERDILTDHIFETGPHGWDTWLFKSALLALEQEDYCDFEIQLEITHNAIHTWIGGSKKYSMGHLHYASYDPLFFVHHSNTDRLWAVWQALQKYRGHNPNEAHCALELMKQPLRPFSFGPPYNLNPMTKEFSRSEDTFEYEKHFHYRYTDLAFVGMNIPALDAFIKETQEKDRVMAGFLLSGFGKSAFVDFDICHNGTCTKAGKFTILGGSAEMPWRFDRLFKYEITDQLSALGLHFNDEYEFRVHVTHPDGTVLDSKLIPTPSVIFVPGKTSRSIRSVAPNHVRRDLSSLEERDISSLKAALHDLQLDLTKDGWGTLASFHGAPARCPDPDHPSVACCQHGMPTFPHWHRLFTLQVERALRRHGSSIAIPYWDWTLNIHELPEVFTKEDFYDVWKDEVYPNPFAHGYVQSEHAYTVRDVQHELFETSPDGKHSKLFALVISALEQTDYCDFEVQFEVMHNAIHYLVGGHQTYSLSSLEYSAYDPIFFIHHSFVDKIWAVWQELQKRRHLPHDRADCAINYMTEAMKPFSFEGFNLDKFTSEHAVPNSVFHYEELGYVYDNLEIGGYNLDELEDLIAHKQSKPRVFAGFLLKGIKTSGSVVLDICPRHEDCRYAGRFNLLGGPLEMPWAFDRLFKLDITSALKEAGFEPEDVFDAEALFTLKPHVYDVEGHALSLKDVMPPPTLIFEPAHGAAADVVSSTIAGVGVRKEVSTLSESEIENLRSALSKVMADDGPNGFQNIASFHGKPANRCMHEGHHIACCLHGMANFPQWHRLFVKQWEDALTAQGAKIGIPYWDWTKAFTELPSLVTEEEHNPFHHGKIYNGEITTRAPRDMLFNDPEFGSESFFYRQALLTFEQTDYCDFEVQYEINHNAIHSWTGGRSPYGMSTLEYTAYDPLFLLHHSNVDRQFAIWQALQKFRGLPYNSANCAIQHLRLPMRPFSDDENVNSVTHSHSRAIDAFDYDSLNYQYDNLNFHGLTISELNDVLEKRKEEDRIFAEFLLHGIFTSADVVFKLCDADNHCEFAGTFAILGGPTEMPWAYDRLFKYDVTSVFQSMNLQPDSDYHFDVHITAVNGTDLDSHLIRSPTVQFVPGVKAHRDHAPKKVVKGDDELIRKDVNLLSLSETAEIRDALYKLQQDHGPNGFEAIAGFHGAPYMCPEGGDGIKHACCMHGMSVFPHWHRLFTVQFEQALKKKGAHVGIPYWDFTKDVHALPYLFGDDSNTNPFYHYTISFNGETTTRDVQDELFHPYQLDDYNHLYHLTLDALEEDNFCDFEVQFEILHNELHSLIGGTGTYSMATLDYSAFDPFFLVLHSTMDRIWLIWEELQKLRHKSFSSARCMGHLLDEPLHPFSDPSVNKNDFTRLNSVPAAIFDHKHFGFEYDHLSVNEHSVEELYNVIEEHRGHTRYYIAGFPHGYQTSLTFEFTVVSETGVEYKAGKMYILGGPKEVPWAYERIWRFDITKVIRDAGISTDKPLQVHMKGSNYTGKPILDETNYKILIEKPAHADYEILTIPIGDSESLPPMLTVKKGTRVRFLATSPDDEHPIEDLGSFTNLLRCNIPPFPYHTYELGVTYSLKPGKHFFASNQKDLCENGRQILITVEDE